MWLWTPYSADDTTLFLLRGNPHRSLPNQKVADMYALRFINCWYNTLLLLHSPSTRQQPPYHPCLATLVQWRHSPQRVQAFPLEERQGVWEKAASMVEGIWHSNRNHINKQQSMWMRLVRCWCKVTKRWEWSSEETLSKCPNFCMVDSEKVSERPKGTSGHRVLVYRYSHSPWIHCVGFDAPFVQFYCKQECCQFRRCIRALFFIIECATSPISFIFLFNIWKMMHHRRQIDHTSCWR